MNIRSSFSILLNLLFLSAIQCYHWNGLYMMYDLEYQGSDFDAEAALWTSSAPLVTSGVKTSQCGSNKLLGGYNILGGNLYNTGKWSRTYSDLPPHNAIYFYGFFYLIDSWETYNDHFRLYFDSSEFIMWWIYSDYSKYASADLCGNSAYNDIGQMAVIFYLPHTASTLTFEVASHFTKTSNPQSLGFRNITMLFVQPSYSLDCAGAFYNGSKYVDEKRCTCAAGKFMTPVNSGFCAACDSSCLTCDGPGNTGCTSCNATEYFYETEKKCSATCESPSTIEIIDNVKICKTQALSPAEVVEIQSVAASIQTTRKATSAGMKAASVINSNSPSSALLAGLSSMMQYIRYMKIKFPPKVQLLFNVSAGSAISSSFGVSIPSIIKENLSDDPLPYAFDKYDINSNFVSNLWDFMVSLILMLLAIPTLTVLKLITSKYRRINLVVSRILQALKWNFPIMMVCGSSGEIVFFASLQLRSSPFSGLSSTICCIVSILMMILVIFLLTMAFKIARTVRKGIINNIPGKTNEAIKWKGFEILYVEYEDNSFYSLAYMFLFLSRNIIFNLTLATLFEYPLVECCIINAFNFMMVCYLIYLRPLKDLFALVQLWINEGLLNVLSISVLILGILDYMEVNQTTTRNGMQDAILIAIKTFNFAALAFTGIGFLIFLRSAIRIWRTGRAKGMRSPLQMFNFLFFGDDDEEKVVEKENQFAKKNLKIEKELRENNNNHNQRTIDLKGETSIVNLNCDTTIIQDTSMKIFQTGFIQRERVMDFEMNHQSISSPKKMRQREEIQEEGYKDMTLARIPKVNLKRRNRMVENPIEDRKPSDLKNDDSENKLWFSKLRRLKARLNDNSKRTDLTIETNMASL